MCNKCIENFKCTCECSSKDIEIVRRDIPLAQGGGSKEVVICKNCKHHVRLGEKTGCFIATAAYGTPFAEEINVLRKWRDEDLLTNPIGRIFVRSYYFISPPIARLIEKSDFSKKLIRATLAPFIKYLKRKNI